MIRVAIVEDNLQEQRVLRFLLEKYGASHQYEFCFSVFTSAEDMLQHFRTHLYDIVFLDIVLPGMNGIETAAGIRQKDSDVILICVTAENGFAVEGYRVELLDYLLKPVDEMQIELTMNRAMKLYHRSKGVNIEIRTAEGPVYVNTSEITYIEIFNHTLLFHLGSKQITSWGSLNQTEEKLSGSDFVRINSGMLVNLKYVTAFVGDSVTVGYSVLPLSRSKKKHFMDRMNRYYAC
jgi:DNA-binding LytR/AlgR family response regulator